MAITPQNILRHPGPHLVANAFYCPINACPPKRNNRDVLTRQRHSGKQEDRWICTSIGPAPYILRPEMQSAPACRRNIQPNFLCSTSLSTSYAKTGLLSEAASNTVSVVTACLSSHPSLRNRHEMDPQLYFMQLLMNLPSWPVNDIDAWLPDRWKQAHAARCKALEIPPLDS